MWRNAGQRARAISAWAAMLVPQRQCVAGEKHHRALVQEEHGTRISGHSAPRVHNFARTLQPLKVNLSGSQDNHFQPNHFIFSHPTLRLRFSTFHSAFFSRVSMDIDAAGDLQVLMLVIFFRH